MSHIYELVCADCDHAMPYEVNNGEIALTELAKHAPKFAEFAATLNLFDIERATFHSPYSGRLVQVHMAWMTKHGAHRLIVKDEYGHVSTLYQRITMNTHSQNGFPHPSTFCTLCGSRVRASVP